LVARIYSVIFVALLVLGFIYQESYMQMSMSEFAQKVDTDKLPFEIFSVSPLQVQQFKNGELTGELSAQEGRLVTTGRFTAQGAVRMRTVSSNVPPEERLSSVAGEKLIATVQRSTDIAFDLFSSSTKFDRVEIPGPAEISSRGHLLVGRSFYLDVPNMTLVTKEPVTVTAVGRKIEAQGAEVELRTRAFKFAGPVRGTEIPPARQEKAARPQKRKSGSKRTNATGGG
jgi:hypothetical protein